MTGETEVDLDALEAEFDELLEAMQKPRARAATRALFRASSAAVGRAAVAHARRSRHGRSLRRR
jgi:hypothetical protein